MYDFDAFLAHDLIGATVFDARSVRELPNHEFYRKWVGLTNSQSNANRSKDNCAAVHRAPAPARTARRTAALAGMQIMYNIFLSFIANKSVEEAPKKVDN